MKTKGRAKQSKLNLTIREKAYQHIGNQIAAGKLPSGVAISELVLAKELGSSRPPVREAIGQLVSEGLLDQTPNLGCTPQITCGVVPCEDRGKLSFSFHRLRVLKRRRRQASWTI